MKSIVVLLACVVISGCGSEQPFSISAEDGKKILDDIGAQTQEQKSAELLMSLDGASNDLGISLVGTGEPDVVAGKALPDVFHFNHDPGFLSAPEQAASNLLEGKLSLIRSLNDYKASIRTFFVIHKLATDLPKELIEKFVALGNRLPPTSFDVIAYIALNDVANDSALDKYVRAHEDDIIKLSTSKNPIYRLLALTRFEGDVSEETAIQISSAALGECNTVFQFWGITNLSKFDAGSVAAKAVESFAQHEHVDNDGTMEKETKLQDVLNDYRFTHSK